VTELEELSAEEGRLEWDTPLFRTALAQFEQAIPYAEVNESIRGAAPLSGACG